MSLEKQIVNNFVPPMNALSEKNDNTHWFSIASFILLGLMIGALSTTIYINHLEIKKTKKIIEANGDK